MHADRLMAAVSYAALGWSVFPIWPIRDGRCACGKSVCDSPGKHPIGSLAPNGFKNGTLDPSILEDWWSRVPDANIAVVTGVSSGVYAVDIDPRYGGDETWNSLVAANGPLPDTPQAKTGGGGRHVLFEYVPGLGGTNGRLGPGIDTKGEGGYILVEPSNHMSGGRYVWEFASHPGKIPLAPIPVWLQALLKEPSQRKVKRAQSIPEVIATGMRNVTLASLAGTMRRRGMGHAAIQAALCETNKQSCRPPLAHEEVLKIAESIASYSAGTLSSNGSGLNQTGPLHPISMQELLNMALDPLTFLVEGLIAKSHLVVLAGRQKGGKSWLALLLAKCVDTGEPFLGRPTRRGRVLYIALEDGKRRVYQRAKLLRWQPSDSAAVLFNVATLDGENSLPGAGLAQIANFAADFDLIILDTFIASLSGAARENDNVQMAAILNALAQLAHENDTCILVIHHTGKGQHDDVFFTLRGASAIRGAYDTGLVLVRKTHEREAILHVESRDFEIESMALVQAANGAGWELLGRPYVSPHVRSGRMTLQAMLEIPGHADGLTVQEIAEARGISEQATRKQLVALERDGHVNRKEFPSTADGRRPDLWMPDRHYED